jgi:hypothetical protein
LKNIFKAGYLIFDLFPGSAEFVPDGLAQGFELFLREDQHLRAILNFTPGPQGLISPLGVNLAPRGELCPLGVKFTPLFTPRGEHSLLFRRMEGQTNNFTLWG